jgi:hypothetical protein
MEELATRENDPFIAGYSVRDYALKVYADFEI